MNFDRFMKTGIIDSHMHFDAIPLVEETRDFLGTLGIERIGIVSAARLGRVNSNPHAMCFKARYPKETYILGGPDYTSIKESSKKNEEALVRQAERLLELGFDGVKLLETKPTFAVKMPFKMDDPVYNGFFAFLEEKRLPIAWHVADPEEFWDKDRVFGNAQDMGWDYTSGGFPTKEDIYTSVENVLARFPKLCVYFAHFYFLSADLPRAGRLLDRFENVNLDITPGTEMFLNFTETLDDTREFFIKYQDRIVFGDDTSIRGDALEKQGITEKICFMRRFLETQEEFPFPPGDRCFLQREGLVRGIHLPEDILGKIYSANFLKMVGPESRKLNISVALEECRRIGDELAENLEFAEKDNFGYEAEGFLKSVNF